MTCHETQVGIETGGPEIKVEVVIEAGGPTIKLQTELRQEVPPSYLL